MAKNVTIAGADYTAVPSVNIPQTGGGTASFFDVSDTTAAASDVASGKWFYNALGVLTAGTASGGGGIEFEQGTWEPTEDVQSTVISFANVHTKAPYMYILCDATGTYLSTSYSTFFVMYANTHQLTGSAIYAGSSTPNYGYVTLRYRSSNASSLSGTTNTLTTSYLDSTDSANSNSRFWATETGIKAYSNTSNRFRTGRTYKWIAFWN